MLQTSDEVRDKHMLILVVEDDARVAAFLERGLREEGHTVDLCARGDEAKAQGLAQPYEVVLLDWGLPGGDGVSVLRGWRAAGMRAAVIVLTARTGVDATVQALDAGADDFIEKPFSFEVLLARIRAVRRRASADVSERGAVVRVGEAEVDLRARAVWRGSERVELSQREFTLLDLLLKHRGEVLSRSRILDRVWGMAHDPSSNVVDVYVRYLRSKLDGADSDHGSVIETHRGRGYRLKLEGEP
jgi:DNA-binding response OmpR family regulator